ncbi:MAG: methyltransferase domain-containing protein [Candidatus Omnitrophica bacterium]|nr:methyltransferase domain-containing protein [Candidatus Omnitrophota bacterium]
MNKIQQDQLAAASKPKTNGSYTLGPIKDLEAHVASNWWKKVFNANYLKTDADVVDDSSITKSEISHYLKILKLDHDQRILDVCCGQGRHVLEFIEQGYPHASGLDRSRFLIQKARTTARKKNLEVKFKEGDARKLPFADCSFDCVTLLGNSFGYFETVYDDIRVLKEVFRVMRPWGKILIDITDGNYMAQNFRDRSWEWIDKTHFVCRERSLSSDKQRLISREIISHAQKGVIVDQFYAERLYSQEDLTTLLTDVGFQDITCHGQINTQSARNQDLGMMEKRLIFTATVRKDWPSNPASKQVKFKQVAVLLGDPSKEDKLKPEAVFDEDDLYTIDCLKNVLSRMEQYHFIYLNNHDQMIQDLLRVKSKVDYVFNLCDEGFNNEAIKELHVPSLLEMLEIPYTGSNPQCLAYCYDKSLVRGIAREMDIRVPEAIFIRPEDNVYELKISFPVLVKPNFGDSSLGITQKSYAENVEQLADAIQSIRDHTGYDKPILVEEFLTGADLSVGIIGNFNEGYTVLPIIEEDYSCLPKGLPQICGYEAKWLPDSPYWNLQSKPAQLGEKLEKYIEEACLRLFERLECRDYCRFDWRLDGRGEPKLLEVNPNPGWCWDGHLAKMAKYKGMSYTTMIEEILKAAEKRLKINGENA